ncbi:MAG: tRNA pseudouridine(38-40) synthase TruA [Janthinobacterium lividum]
MGIQYDGGNWHGWQTQPDGHTVQDRLQAALKKFTGQAIAVTCAGRTDSGVHAIEQVVHFDVSVQRSPFSWVRGVNASLPPSIAVRWAHVLANPGDAGDNAFHARFSATARHYRYLLYNHPVRSPLLVGRAGWAFRTLDVDAMREAASHLLGEHDFSAFRAVECQARSPVRTLSKLVIERRGDMLVLDLAANAFLHHMVRNIVGSLVYVGHGAREPGWIAALLASRNRALAAPTFMPDGLYLARVDYDAGWGLPQQPWPDEMS